MQDGRRRQLFFCQFKYELFLWCVLASCIYLCKAGLRRWNPHACCPFHLRDKQEESRGAAGNKPPTPSPSGHGAFYIPPSISITISVSSPHARHNVDDSVEGTYRQRLSEEPAAAAEEADRRRYERSSQSRAAKQKRGWKMKWCRNELVESRGDNAGLEKHFWSYKMYRVPWLMSIKHGYFISI